MSSIIVFPVRDSVVEFLEINMNGLYLVLYFLSGFSVLALEIVWVRFFSIRIGSSVTSAALVMSSFFLFAGLGNHAGKLLIAGSKNKKSLYGTLEVLFALSMGLTYALRNYMPFGTSLLSRIIAVSAAVGVPFFISGCTFPALMELFINRTGTRTSHGGRFYAVNLIGGSLGLLAGGLYLPIAVGYNAVYYCAVLISFAVGIAALKFAGRITVPCTIGEPEKIPDESGNMEKKTSPTAGYIIICFSGILSITLEVLIMHYFQQILSPSIYNVTIIMFAFILNLGLGALLASRLKQRGYSTEILLTVFLWITGISVVICPFLFYIIMRTKISRILNSFPLGEISIIPLVMGILMPIVVPMGAVFPLAWETVKRKAAHHGAVLGFFMFINNAGSALGALIAGFLFISILGLPYSFLLTGTVYMVLAFMLSRKINWHSPRTRSLYSGAVLISIVVLIVSITFKKEPVTADPEETILGKYSGPGGIVTVIRDKYNSHHIVLNQSYTLNGTEKAMLTLQNMAWIPLFLSKSPERVLHIGMGSGISANAVLDFPIKEFHTVELLPEIVKAARKHFAKWNDRLFRDPRVSVMINDGRAVIQSSLKPYDLIICDLFNPIHEGVSSMYSIDFFKIVRDRLSEDGMFCIWLALCQFDDELAGITINTFSEVFTNAIAVRGNFDPIQNVIGLIGMKNQIDLSASYINERLNMQEVKIIAEKSPFFRSTANARLLLFGDLQSLKQEFSTYPINSDNCPIIAYKGPRVKFKKETLRGYTILEWFGARMINKKFPSIWLGKTSEKELLNGVRAGNHYFAASMPKILLLENYGNREKNLRQMKKYIKKAENISPGSDIKPGDLGW